jgi:hypothetical protein
MTNPNPSNVTSIESKQPAPAGAKFTINAMFDGFPIQIEVEGAADRLRAMIERLKAIGAEPPQVASAPPTKIAGAPLCPVHNKAMKPSAKPGKFYCPRRSDNGEYCRETA